MTNERDIFGRDQPDGELYHYTSMRGLQGIVGGRSLWATNIEFFNDSNEFSYGQGIITPIVESYKQRV